VNGARLSGVHLALPGYQGQGPTLEIYQYSQSKDKSSPIANREGFGHIAFEVEDEPTALDIVQQHGGDAIGEVVSKEIVGVGILTFVYAADPEGNIVELQSWK
jgi:catechol 2,3-dioxygenase-like lactoylglutathione lyase family enzyme